MDKTFELYGLFAKEQPDVIRYVGLTTVGVSKRFSEHLNHAQSNYSRLPVALWIVKHGGRCGVDYKVLATATTLERLNALEVETIAAFRERGWADLNVLDGGAGGYGHKHTPEFKAKVSATHKGKFVSEETRRRISEAKTGKKINRDPSTFGPISEEHKRKISVATKGRPKPEGHGQNVSRGLRNKHGMAKLNESQAREILQRSLAGEPSAVLAGEFGVRTTQVNRIRTGERWGYLQHDFAQ